MQTLQFKTNLKCNGCVQAITPGMDAINEITSWNVNLDVEDKTLEVEFCDISENNLSRKVIDVVTNAGYTIEKL